MQVNFICVDSEYLKFSLKLKNIPMKDDYVEIKQKKLIKRFKKPSIIIVVLSRCFKWNGKINVMFTFLDEDDYDDYLQNKKIFKKLINLK